MGSSLRQRGLFVATLMYSVLSVVFRWFVGVLISKIFFISSIGMEGAQTEIKFVSYLALMFLESWTFYEVIWSLVIASVILSFLRGIRSYLNQIIVIEDSIRLRSRLFEAMLDYERNHSGIQALCYLPACLKYMRCPVLT